MESKKGPSLEEFEVQVKTTIRTKHKNEISLIEKLLNHYLAGFNRIGKFALRDDNELEYAWLLLVTRSFNSLRCAFDLLQKGYYSQAMMLIRAVDEDYLICRDCEKERATLDSLIKGEGKLRRGKLSYVEMARRISEEFCDTVWKDNYGQESEIAHASQRALKILVDPDTNTLMLGSHYDSTLFVATCHALLRVAVGMAEFIVRLLGDSAPQWQQETYSTIHVASTYVVRISEEAKSTSEKEE